MKRLTGMRLDILAFIWGCAEATLFFIVPDVFLTLVAIIRPERVWRACFAAALGALVGGVILFVWASLSPHSATNALLALPAIDEALIARANAQLTEFGVPAFFIGAFSGIPFKLYVLSAATGSLALPLLIAIALPVRLARFWLVALIARMISDGALTRRPLRLKIAVWLIAWLVFYALYFTLLNPAGPR